MSDGEMNSILSAISTLTEKVEGYHVVTATAIAKIETRCEERHEKQPQNIQRGWTMVGVIAAVMIGIGSMLVAIFKGK